MKKCIALIAIAIGLAGCASYSPSIPENYTGPRATIKDTVKTHSSSKADFFYLQKIDGREIRSSLAATFEANYGRGMAMTPVVLSNEIPAQDLRIEIVGRTYHAAAIQSFMGTEYI